MIITKKALPRRTFLRGMGAALSLPLLDAMVPALTAEAATAANPVRRLTFVYIPMGAHMPLWTPPGEQLSELSPILKPLQSVADRITVLSNLELRNAYPGTHATSNSAFLSSATAKWTESSDYYLGTTVDQIAAKYGVASVCIKPYAVRRAVAAMRPGVTEREIAWVIDRSFREQGAFVRQPVVEVRKPAIRPARPR